MSYSVFQVQCRAIEFSNSFHVVDHPFFVLRANDALLSKFPLNYLYTSTEEVLLSQADIRPSRLVKAYPSLSGRYSKQTSSVLTSLG